MCFTVRNLNDEVLSFNVSDNVVFTTSSSSLSPELSAPWTPWCPGEKAGPARTLCLTQVQQRGPCSSLGLGRVDLERAPGRCGRLPEGIILRSRNLLPVALSILVLRKCSLGIHVQCCIKVEGRLILCCGLHWRGSGEWGTWSGIPWLAVVPRPSHWRSRRSHGSPGLSAGLLGPPDKRTDRTLRSMEEPLWRLGSCWRSSRSGWSRVVWVTFRSS